MLVFLDDITIRLGEQPAFNGTTWAIQRGQHWAMIGPSGSGKTVLSKALAGRLPLMGGQIHYFFDGPPGDGRGYLYPSEILTFSGETHRQFLGRFAAYHQARWQSFEGEEAPTVAALLENNGRSGRSPFEVLSPDLSHRPPLEGDELVDLLGLRPLLGRRVHLLSHGESRKVFLARLLLRAPRLLILDDPFTGLDQETRARLRTGIDRLFGHPDLSILCICARPEDLPAGITHLLQVNQMQVTCQGSLTGTGAGALEQSPQSPDPPSPPPRSSSLEQQLAGYASTLQKHGKAAPDELVRMTGVSVAYHGVTVLEDIHWTVRSGERWALLGPNGAGKTTLLSLILADNPQAYRSDITLFGRKRGSGESIWEIKRQTGWVSPELHAFYDRSDRVLDVILSGFYDSVGLHHHPTTEQRAEAIAWLEVLGLPADPSTPFASLSAGQQRLALLGRALVKQPPLLILDEPCQGLDERQRSLFLGFVEQLCAHTPLALVYVTHEQDELPAAITHRLRLAQGKVVFCGKNG